MMKYGRFAIAHVLAKERLVGAERHGDGVPHQWRIVRKHEGSAHDHADRTVAADRRVKEWRIFLGACAYQRAIGQYQLDLQAGWPQQSSRAFLARILQYGTLRLLSQRLLYGLLLWLLTWVGLDHDTLLNRSTRSILPAELFAIIRQRPCAAQLRLLQRRLQRYERARVRDRAQSGAALAAQLDPRAVDVPGRQARSHSFWVMPVNATNPARLIDNLLRAGFDATPGASSMMVLSASDGRALPCPGANRTLRNVVYLPVQPGLDAQELVRLRDAINASAGGAA